ncbi:MAG: undecaprenyl-diphosphate phosphatase [Oscillospiraceae bacterium]|nr:undecaprenyl-diphosphate phosphatase [Oscillospiraceae bacterium]
MLFFEIIKSIVLGVVEGITEWLPVSSTGHMILVNEIINNKGTFTASDLYLYVIQLGAILAVVTLYFHKLNPFSPSKSAEEKADTWKMWFKVLIACVPAAVIGLLLDDFMETFENWQVVSATLIIYGVAFVIVERLNKKATVNDIDSMSYKTAFLIGMFQVLSIIPGTSRSGSTIIGAILIGCSRTVAAEFSFFLAIPVMFGVSLLKIVKSGLAMTGNEIAILLTGMVVAYIVSMLAIKFLMNYVRKHDFKGFGYYRIALGLLVIVFFTIQSFM